jgi:hypothetical protein
MILWVCLGFAMFAVTPGWSQLEATPFETAPTSYDNSRMLIPPPVSGVAYPTTVGSQTRSNYLAGGFVFSTAYNDNVPVGGSTVSTDDVIYSIGPTITLNQTTVRQHLALSYSPGFTFYQHTSELNAANQNAVLDFQYGLSPHTTLRLGDSFQKSSNVFDQLDSVSGVAISGSTLSPPTQVIAPFADRLSNTANADLSYQFSRNGMIGAGGIIATSNYPSPAQASGLYNSRSGGGSAFYNRRLSSGQYIGVTYQYLRSQGVPVNALANPANVQNEVETHTVLPFYTIYFGPALSLSLSCGPQYFDAAESISQSFHSWVPSATASIGLQKSYTNFVASYSRTVTGGVGLPGIFNSNSASASLGRQITRTWNLGLAASYAINKNITPFLPSSSPGGHSISGTVSVQHSLSEHLKVEVGYLRLHQSYDDIVVISSAPDSDRGFISVSYQLSRPLGR